MAEKLEAKEQETVAGVEVMRTHDAATITKGKDKIQVHSYVFALQQAGEATASEDFTREVFEDALDKTSRPVKGKYADVLPSSEEFIKDKRREAELEDR